MLRKAVILPVCTVTLLAAGQFAAAQSIQPTSPCPPGKVAQNYNRGTEGVQTAQKHDRGTAGNAQTAQNSGRGTSLQVAGKPIDPLDCR